MAEPRPALWRVVASGGERRPAGAIYNWSNHDRTPTDVVCFQTVDAGRVRITRPDGSASDASAGECHLFRYGEASSYGFPPGQRLVHETRWVSMSGAGLAEHWDELRAEGGWIRTLDADLDGMFTRLLALAQPGARTPPTTIAAAIHGLVVLLYERGAAATRAAAAPVDRAIAELVAAPLAPWSIKELADSHDISREHLTRAFTARMGSPPAAWLTAARLDHALHLLRETGMSVSDIARQCGFGSTHTLARQVRARTGDGPVALRRGR